MFSIFTHVMKPVRDTNSEPGLPVVFGVNFFHMCLLCKKLAQEAVFFFLQIYLANRHLHCRVFYNINRYYYEYFVRLVSIDRVTTVGPNPFSERLNDRKSTILLSLSF